MSKIQGVIFDMDGTIVDTESLAAGVVEDVFREASIQLEAADATAVTGRRFDAALGYLFDKYLDPKIHGNDPSHGAHPERITARIMTRYREVIETEVGTVVGAVDAVKEISQHFPVALVTGSSHLEVEKVMGKLGITSCFRALLAAEDYERSKPAPDGFLKAMGILGVAPEQTLVFEDSTPGIASARAAGAWVAAITSTNHFRQDQSQAHWKIPDFQGIDSRWIKALE